MHKTLFLRIMCTMKKALTTVHTILVIIILIATAGWSSYYLFNQRNVNSEVVAKKIPAIASDIAGFLKENDSLYNNAFSDQVKDLFETNKDLTALTIYSYDTGIEYFYSRNNEIRIKSTDSGDGDPTPEYKGLGFVHSIGSIPLSLAEKPGSNIDCIYSVLPRGSIFYVLKISLIVVIALFFITLLLIVIFSLSADQNSIHDEDDHNEWDSAEAEDDSDMFHDDSNDFQESSGDDFNLPGDDFSMDQDDTDSSQAFDMDSSSSDEMSFDDDFNLPDDDSLDLDDLNLEESIPDIPEEEDLMEMDHQESSISLDTLPDEDEEIGLGDLDDFNLPTEDDFSELSSMDSDMSALDLEDDITEITEDEDITESMDNAEHQPSLYNPDSGLGWEHFLEERLSLELERAASFDQDLVLIILRNNDENSWDQFTSLVKEKFSYSDLVFEAGKNEMAIIDPNKDLDESISDIQNFLKGLETSLGHNATSAGLSSRNGRLISGSRLIREAATSLNKTDQENPIVGFRSDPERFREFLGKNN